LLRLYLTGTFDPLTHRGRWLAGPAVREFLMIDPRRFAVDVDPIEQWSADPFSVTPNRLAGTFLFPHGIANVPAEAGIHRRHDRKSVTTDPACRSRWN
jgi:hypothetical protein